MNITEDNLSPVVPEQEEEIKRFETVGITEEEYAFIEAEAAVALGEGNAEQEALVEEKLKQEPWRRAYFETLQQSKHLFSEKAKKANLERVGKEIGIRFSDSSFERNEDGPESDRDRVSVESGLIFALENVVGGLKAILPGDIFVGAQASGKSSVSEGGQEEQPIDGVNRYFLKDEVILSWSTLSNPDLPTEGTAYIESKGIGRLESKIEGNELDDSYEACFKWGERELEVAVKEQVAIGFLYSNDPD